MWLSIRSCALHACFRCDFIGIDALDFGWYESANSHHVVKFAPESLESCAASGSWGESESRVVGNEVSDIEGTNPEGNGRVAGGTVGNAGNPGNTGNADDGENKNTLLEKTGGKIIYHWIYLPEQFLNKDMTQRVYSPRDICTRLEMVCNGGDEAGGKNGRLLSITPGLGSLSDASNRRMIGRAASETKLQKEKLFPYASVDDCAGFFSSLPAWCKNRNMTMM